MSRAPEVVIDCHIDDVFAFMADFRHAPRWLAGVMAVDQSGGDGPGPGARYDVVRRIGGRSRRTVVTCAGWDPPRSLTWRDDAGEARFALEPVWTATRVTGGTPRDLRRLCDVLEGRSPRPRRSPLAAARAWLTQNRSALRQRGAKLP